MSRIRKVTPNGIISTLVGLALGTPSGVAVDDAGNLYVANTYGNTIHKVSPNGIISVLVGNSIGYTGDGGAASSAAINFPGGVTVDKSGKVYIADSGNQAIRLLQPTSSALSITSASPLSIGTVGAPYSQTLTAFGGATPYIWSLTAGILPAGLTLSGAGIITGTPTVAGSSTFTIQVSDSLSAIATQVFSLTINSGTSGLTIITTSPLPSGSVGGAYSQTLAATGGNPPYTWSTISGALPSGLTLSGSGAITGTPTAAGTSTFTVRVIDSALTNVTQTFSLTIIAVGPLVRSGVLAHVASGGGWKTTISLINTSSVPVAARIVFWADDGSALNLPLTLTQQGGSQVVTSASLDRVISPNTTLLIDTQAQTSSTLVGWADVLSSGPVKGFAIFRQTGASGSASEGTVPLQSQFQSTLILPYDNTAGFVTGIAIASLATAGATITATIWDENGFLLGTQSITLAGNGHTSFALPDRLPLTSGKRGIVQFLSSSTSGLTSIGLRFSPFGTFTSVPTILP